MGNKIGNIHAWFVLHRGMMISAILCTIAAFITIFVAIGGWSESAGRHAILGCIVVACMTVNPIMALFRPKPDHPKRGYFNLFHGVLGGVGDLHFRRICRYLQFNSSIGNTKYASKSIK